MWRQFKRMVESNLGRFKEDPLSRRPDLEALRSQLATVRAQVALLEKDAARLDREEAQLGERIRTALAAGDREAGLRHAETLRSVREDRARIERQLEAARRVCRNAEGVQATYAPSGPSPAAGGEDPLVVAAAEETLRRLEQDLHQAGASTAGKSIGAGVEGVADSGPQAAVVKTIGGGEPDPSATAVAAERGEGLKGVDKTIGKTLGKAASKTVGGSVDESSGAQAARPQEATPSAAEGGEPDLVTELERLARLREQGILTQEEFEQAKRRLLER